MVASQLLAQAKVKRAVNAAKARAAERAEISVANVIARLDNVAGRAKGDEEIRGLLNAGHRKGAVAGRCVVRGKQVFTEEVPAYCDLCGPVYLWAAVMVAGCPWCWNRLHGVAIPRPSRREVA